MASRIASRPEGALPVDGQRRHAVAQARGKADDARRIAARGGIAEDDLVDRARLELRVLQRRLHHRRRQALDAPALVQSARPAEGPCDALQRYMRLQSRGLGHGERTRWDTNASPAVPSAAP
jgi:hypothetical protein